MDSRASEATSPSIGSTLPILDDYVVGQHRERRPVADVYDAVHRYSGTPHVIYVLRPRAMQDHALVHRIGCEVDAARWLRHPAVPKLDRQGETPSRRLYVAVERPAGRSVRALVAESGPVTPQDLIRIGAPVVEALEDAHAVGLVHGRVTPDAVVVAEHAEAHGILRVALTGVGLASIARHGDLAAEDLPFVSPEQLGGGEPDARSDVFGLAAVLDFMLRGDTSEHSAPGGDAIRSRFAAADHPELARVLQSAQSTDPRLRPASVKAFWEEVLAALVTGAPVPTATTLPTSSDRALTAPMPPTRRRRLARTHAWWLAVPMAAALGWPLASSAAHARTVQRSQAAGEVVRPAAHAPVPAPAPVIAQHEADRARGADERTAADSTAARSAAERSSGERHAKSDARRSDGPTAKHADSAVRAAAPAAPRIEVPTVIVIMDADQRARNATPTRPGEFDNDFNRTLKKP